MPTEMDPGSGSAQVRCAELTLARGPALGLDDEPWLLKPLPQDRVARALTAAGFVTGDGSGVDPAELLIDGNDIGHRDEVAQVGVLVHEGLRALHIEPLDGSRAQWDQMIAPLQALATSLHTRLLPDDRFED